jgi:excisionase family DNA binding protein
MTTIRRDSIDEAADEFGVSRDLLYRMAQRRAIPHSRIGSVLRVNLDELAEHFDRPATALCRCPHEATAAGSAEVAGPPKRPRPRVEQIVVDYAAM